MSKENGTESPTRIGVNTDREHSLDRGCMQVNNVWHPDFTDWANPEANTAKGYSIFKSRGNWSAWYAVCTPNREPKYPGIWCK
jgi:hypothetical protein